MNVQADLVDQVRLEQRVRQFAAAHHTDAFALSPFQLPEECGSIRRYDFHLFVGALAHRARKHVVLHARIGTRATLQRDLIGLAPHYDGVDGLHEFRRRGRYLLAPQTPITRMVCAGDTVVEAVGDTERVFADFCLAFRNEPAQARLRFAPVKGSAGAKRKATVRNHRSVFFASPSASLISFASESSMTCSPGLPSH